MGKQTYSFHSYWPLALREIVVINYRLPSQQWSPKVKASCCVYGGVSNLEKTSSFLKLRLLMNNCFQVFGVSVGLRCFSIILLPDMMLIYDDDICITHSVKLTFLLISNIECASCCCAIGCWCMPRLHEPQLVYLYNRFPLKPRYLSGQEEVWCLMSALQPQMGGTCHGQEALSREWLGIRIGDRHPVFSVGFSPMVTPTLAWWEAGMEGLIGCLDGSVGCLQWQRTHKDLEDHTHTHTRSQELILHGVPWAVTFLHRWQPLPRPLYPRALVILSFLFFSSLRRPNVECVIRIQQDLITVVFTWYINQQDAADSAVCCI